MITIVTDKGDILAKGADFAEAMTASLDTHGEVEYEFAFSLEGDLTVEQAAIEGPKAYAKLSKTIRYAGPLTDEEIAEGTSS